MLMIEPGTKNGEILRGPPASTASCVSSISGSPPMPEPMQTPICSRFSRVEIEARVLDRFDRRGETVVDEGVEAAHFLRRKVLASASKPLTSPAICEVKADGSKRVMRAMPDLPARMFDQASGTPMPTGADDSESCDDYSASGQMSHRCARFRTSGAP